jgi:hypothetical protein
MSTVSPATSARGEYISTLSKAGLDAPWMEPGPLIRPKASAMQAGVWRWQEIEPLVRRSPGSWRRAGAPSGASCV